MCVLVFYSNFKMFRKSLRAPEIGALASSGTIFAEKLKVQGNIDQQIHNEDEK